MTIASVSLIMCDENGQPEEPVAIATDLPFEVAREIVPKHYVWIRRLIFFPWIGYLMWT